MANKHFVTVDGVTFKRTSLGRVYTHAVVTAFHGWPEDKTRAMVNWCGSYALGLKQVAKNKRMGNVKFSAVFAANSVNTVSESPFAHRGRDRHGPGRDNGGRERRPRAHSG